MLDDGFVRECCCNNDSKVDGGDSNSVLVNHEANLLPFAAVKTKAIPTAASIIDTTLTAKTGASSPSDYRFGHVIVGQKEVPPALYIRVKDGRRMISFRMWAMMTTVVVLVSTPTIIWWKGFAVVRRPRSPARGSGNIRHESPNKFTNNASIAAAPLTLAPWDATSTIANTAMPAAATPVEMPHPG